MAQATQLTEMVQSVLFGFPRDELDDSGE